MLREQTPPPKHLFQEAFRRFLIEHPELQHGDRQALGGVYAAWKNSDAARRVGTSWGEMLWSLKAGGFVNVRSDGSVTYTHKFHAPPRVPPRASGSYALLGTDSDSVSKWAGLAHFVQITLALEGGRVLASRFLNRFLQHIGCAFDYKQYGVRLKDVIGSIEGVSVEVVPPSTEWFVLTGPPPIELGPTSPTSTSRSDNEARPGSKEFELYKTELCRYFVSGACARQARCAFAHGEQELRRSTLLPAALGFQPVVDSHTLNWEAAPSSAERPRPREGERYKTELCRYFDRSGACALGSRCGFAHGQSELREAGSGLPDSRPAKEELYKTELCSFFATGTCARGPRCGFAHGEVELRLGLQGARAQGSAWGTWPLQSSDNPPHALADAANGLSLPGSDAWLNDANRAAGTASGAQWGKPWGGLPWDWYLHGGEGGSADEESDADTRTKNHRSDDLDGQGKSGEHDDGDEDTGTPLLLGDLLLDADGEPTPQPVGSPPKGGDHVVGVSKWKFAEHPQPSWSADSAHSTLDATRTSPPLASKAWNNNSSLWGGPRPVAAPLPAAATAAQQQQVMMLLQQQQLQALWNRELEQHMAGTAGTATWANQPGSHPTAPLGSAGTQVGEKKWRENAPGEKSARHRNHTSFSDSVDDSDNRRR
eukprot:CAMPEP_0114552848 /NCGR_PEP_ID=MMETSP0114-20121206/7339_1 /TAXON_ID=31324 /ORGANISM="Goniomonas sp, Strain m" /LENGTH=653 /DNA_ID=CAMNT_0001737743 /DNA_START=51 /DNA_END=2013 /DNA_ORIENTATION=-